MQGLPHYEEAMRTAIVSDIHGNQTAFEAVLADIRKMSPDVVLHGGDLADCGSSPVAVVDSIRELGWQGVRGNTDEMLFAPQSLQTFASHYPNLKNLFELVEEMAAVTRAVLGEERLDWLRSLPLLHVDADIALMHASPETPWRAPTPEASDAELESVYGFMSRPIAVYGHIHRPFVRRLSSFTVANAGSVGLSYDGDRRASYLLIDDTSVEIRRVEYDVAAEVRSLSCCGLPNADWVASLLEKGKYQMP